MDNYGDLKHKYLFTHNSILNCMVYCIYISVLILFPIEFDKCGFIVQAQTLVMVSVRGLHGWSCDLLLAGAAGHAADDI